VEAFDPFDGEAVAGAVVNGGLGDEAEDVYAFEGMLEFVHHHAAEDVFRLMDAGRVYQDDLSVFAIQDALDAVAGGLGFGGDDGDFLADEGIDERGFARVGAAYDCDETGFEGHGSANCTPLERREEDGRGSVRGVEEEVKGLNTECTEERRRTRRQIASTAETRRAQRKAEGKETLGKLSGLRELHYGWMNWRRTICERGFLRFEFLTSRLIVIDFMASRFIAATLAAVFPRSTR
jgi:hypothetical protein